MAGISGHDLRVSDTGEAAIRAALAERITDADMDQARDFLDRIGIPAPTTKRARRR